MIAIKDNHFTGPDGNRYFRRNAPAVSVGAWGEKKTPLTQANYLEVAGAVPYGLLDGKVRQLPPVAVDWGRESRAAVEASATVYFAAGGTAAFTHGRAREARLQLVRFHVDGGDLTRVLNDADAVRAELRREGADARVCSSAWVVMSGELAGRFATAARLAVSATGANGLSVTAEGGAAWEGEERITLSPGAVFAYGLHKVDRWKGDLVGAVGDDWQSVG